MKECGNGAVEEKKMITSTETVLWAGSIVRYHNRPTAQRQTVGEHTWRMLVIYTELYGMPRAEVYQNIIYHDVTEIITGDMPFMAKRYYPDLAYILKTREFDAEDKLKINFPEITKEEKLQIKVCDLLEMLFFAVDDVKMGCQFSTDIVHNIVEALEDYENATKIWQYIWDKKYKRAIDGIRSGRTG